MDETRKRQTEEYALKVLRLAKDTITVRFRFFDKAISKYRFNPTWGLMGYVADGESISFDPQKLLLDYANEANFPVRLILHIIFHSIFLHPYRFDKADENYWNIACDIAVENIILEMELEGASLIKDDEERVIITKLRKWISEITAEKIYREFMVGGISKESEARYKKLFSMDTHRPRVNYKDEPETILSEEDWEKIAERVKAELASFSKKAQGGETITKNLKEATRKRYDYEAILKRFSVMGEQLKVNPDEFDYIYYTYGLKTYKNMPLIEPLEYAEDKRIKEFVIAIDTSASVRGEMVTKFLEKTYDILNNSGSFFSKVNIHVIQCDAKIQSDTNITCKEDLKQLMENFKLTGFGATDFRPVFDYVDDLIEKKEFENLKGLVYLTDGYGIYPSKAPKYDTIFAFLGQDDLRPKLPAWAIKVVLEDE